MKIKTNCEFSWVIKNRIKTFKAKTIYTYEEIGDDRVIKSILRCNYAEKVIDNPKSKTKMIKDYENKSIGKSKNINLLENEDLNK